MSWISGFDVSDLSEDSKQDVEGLDASAAHVLSLLSTEPADGKFYVFILYLLILCRVYIFIILKSSTLGEIE